mgnify:CR=1 FL=1
MSQQQNNNSNILSFLLGLTVGAILGILFAPAEGKETRKKLAKYIEDLEEKSEDIINKGKKFVEEETDKVKKFVEDTKEKIVKQFSKEQETK